MSNTISQSVTCPIALQYRLIKEILDYRESAVIQKDVADFIKAIDSSGVHYHIEYPTKENGLKASEARLWHAAEWKTLYSNYVIKKQFDMLQRNVYLRAEEVRNKLAAKLCAQLGMDSVQDVQEAASRLVGSRKKEISEHYRVRFDELWKADEELFKFKQEKGLK